MHLQYPTFVPSCSHDSLFWYNTCVWMISYLYYMFAFTSKPSHFLVSNCGLYFYTLRISFIICCKAGLLVLNSPSFCLSVRFLQIWMEAALGCGFFPCIILTILCHSFLACRVSAEKSADNFYENFFVCYLLLFSRLSVFSLCL